MRLIWIIAKKEIFDFFFSLQGYIILSVYFLLSSFYLLLFSNSFNIIEAEFADLNLFFKITPWLFLFIIPAMGMRIFSEEIKSGTLEFLFSKPLSTKKLILGKFIGSFFLLLCASVICFVYIFIVFQLKHNSQLFDWSVFWGSYLSLILLSSVFLSISLWCSSLTENQVIAFLLSVLICFVHFYGWEQIAFILDSNASLYGIINQTGLLFHYIEISKGVLSSTSILYLLGQNVFFLYCCQLSLEKKRL